VSVTATPAIVSTLTAMGDAMPVPDEQGFVDVRGSARNRAGTVTYDAVDLVTGWHSHALHQLEYALDGSAQVETANGRYLLPPQQAMWIPAGLEHCTTLQRVRSIAVFFEPSMVPDGGDRARVLAITPLLREMVVEAVRWPVTRPSSDQVGDTFFDALALLVTEQLDREAPLWLPTSADPLVSQVMAETLADLRATGAEIRRRVGASERTVRRQFTAATGITWHAYRSQARLLHAVTLLASSDRSILDVATASGFESVGSFGRAFSRLTGDTPSGYRRRVRAGSNLNV
jgi:AraC-like DNA-binding protein/quercetin dioxygenase-like cupin family protein